MSYDINTTDDVYKFTQVLYDYLNMHGLSSIAQSLSSVADGCFETSQDALQAHKEALTQIRQSNIELPSEHQQAVEKSLRILKEL